MSANVNWLAVGLSTRQLHPSVPNVREVGRTFPDVAEAFRFRLPRPTRLRVKHRRRPLTISLDRLRHSLFDKACTDKVLN